MSVSAFGLNATLKLLEQMLDALHRHGVTTSNARIVDHDVRPGVSHDEGEGDHWPVQRRKSWTPTSW